MTETKIPLTHRVCEAIGKQELDAQTIASLLQESINDIQGAINHLRKTGCMESCYPGRKHSTYRLLHWPMLPGNNGGKSAKPITKKAKYVGKIVRPYQPTFRPMQYDLYAAWKLARDENPEKITVHLIR